LCPRWPVHQMHAWDAAWEPGNAIR